MDIDNKQLARDIENAIRARGLKEQMQQWEAARKQTAEHPRIPTQEELISGPNPILTCPTPPHGGTLRVKC